MALTGNGIGERISESGRSAARLARLLREQEAGSSNLPAPTTSLLCGPYKRLFCKKLSLAAWLFSLCLASLLPAAVLAGADATYHVSSGDNLSVIAARYGVRLADLRRANNLSSDLIRVNQKLVIPQPFAQTRARDVRWARPLSRVGPVLRPFGPYKVKGVIMPRTGTDVACPWGTRISSPANAVVRHIGHMEGMGTLMILEHGGGYATVLSPFDPESITVQLNQAVNRGQLLGKSGRPDDLPQEPFLHVELRANEKSVEPSRLLK